MSHPQVLQLALQPLLQVARCLRPLAGEGLRQLRDFLMSVSDLSGKLLEIRLAGL